MHIPSLVKIHWYLLKLSSGNEITDEWTIVQQMDGHTDNKSEAIIRRHYCMAVYKTRMTPLFIKVGENLTFWVSNIEYSKLKGFTFLSFSRSLQQKQICFLGIWIPLIGNRYIFRGGNSCHIVLPSFWKGFYAKREENSFPLE